MNVSRHSNAREFLTSAGEWLEARPAENNLALGIARGLIEHPARFTTDPWLLTVDTQGRMTLAAVMTPPHRLIVTGRETAAIRPLAAHLLAAGAPVSGVVGPPEVADAFAELWSSLTGRTPGSGMRQGIYECDRVAIAPPSPGNLRPAKSSDETLLVNWAERFAEDAHLQAPTRLDDLVRQRIASGDMFIWHDRRAVTMACVSGQTARGARVGFVYTPPALRRRGYATSCVAALTQQLFDRGRQFAYLYTDLANPTSNAIYQRIGYRFVCESREWVFG